MSILGRTRSIQTSSGTENASGRLRSSSQPHPSVGSVHVLVWHADLVAAAKQVARDCGGSLQVIRQDELSDRVDTLLRLSGSSTLVVGPRADIDDDLLLDALGAMQRFIEGEDSWESVPTITFLSGRDVPHVRALCERFHDASVSPDRTARFVHVQGGDESAQTISWELDQELGGRARRTTAGGDPLRSLLREPAAAIAYQTHGGEACARGGGGVVLCGRSERPTATPAGTPGVLACGRDVPCPRGPFPLPLRELRTPIFLLASCNGLRLADGALTADFNLGLSFLDGVGQAYVSSVSGTRGNHLASRIFLPAIASGASVEEAVALTNAALVRTGTDLPRFVTLGWPMVVAAPHLARTAPMRVSPTGAGALEIDAGTEHFVELLIEDERICRLADENALALSMADSDSDVVWFSRPEAVQSSVGTPARQLRLFLFRLADPIRRLHLEVGDRRDTRSDALRWLSALHRWLERWRTFGLSAREAEVYTELRAAYDDAAATLSRALGGLAWSTAGRSILDAHCSVIRSLAQVAAAEVTSELQARLHATFWLTNEDAAMYELGETRDYVCSACGRRGNERRLCNPVTGEARRVQSCCRCGIVFDGDANGYVQALKVRAPDVVACGSRFELKIELELDPKAVGQTVSLYPCLTTHMVDQVMPEPRQRCVSIESGGDSVITFNFDVPASLIPHQHFLKVIAATEQELVFASRILFVE